MDDTSCAWYQAVNLFKPIFRLGYPENYSFIIYKQILKGPKYPENIVFHFEKQNIGLKTTDLGHNKSKDEEVGIHDYKETAV